MAIPNPLLFAVNTSATVPPAFAVEKKSRMKEREREWKWEWDIWSSKLLNKSLSISWDGQICNTYSMEHFRMHLRGIGRLARHLDWEMQLLHRSIESKRSKMLGTSNVCRKPLRGAPTTMVRRRLIWIKKGSKEKGKIEDRWADVLCDDDPRSWGGLLKIEGVDFIDLHPRTNRAILLSVREGGRGREKWREKKACRREGQSQPPDISPPPPSSSYKKRRYVGKTHPSVSLTSFVSLNCAEIESTAPE